MIKVMKRLPDSELEVMMTLWNAGVPLSRADIEAALSSTKDWAATTVLTFLARLIEKGYVSCEKRGRFNMYSAYVSRSEYIEWESQTFLDRFYDSSVSNFVASACLSQSISSGDIDELQRLLSGMKLEKEVEG